MFELIKECFELFVKQNWLKHIDRAVDEYNKLTRKAKVQAHIVHELMARYNELYPDDKLKIGGRDGND